MSRQNKIEGSVQFVISKVWSGLLHRLDRFPQQQHIAAMLFNPTPETLQVCMGFRQTLAAGSLGFEQKGNGIESEAVHTFVEPEVDHPKHGLLDRRVGVVEIGLMSQKAMQVVALRHGIPLPVGGLEMAEQHGSIAVRRRVIAPDIKIPFRGAIGGPAGSLKPGMQVAGVVQHQIQDDLHPLVMGRSQEAVERSKIA